MRILVCNDDGIDAPGIARLVNAAKLISDDVWVVAPEVKHTAASSSLTIAKPLTIHRVAEKRYSCSGRPADCVVVAMTWLFENQEKPGLILSGVNDGRNVAEDLAYSGTLGIAREASFWDVPAIGFSRVKEPAYGLSDETWLSQLIATLWAQRQDWVIEGHFLSINLPASLPAKMRQPLIGRDKIARRAEIVEQDAGRTVVTVPRGRRHATQPGDENDLIDGGYVTINRLNWFGETPLGGRLLAALE